MTAPSGKQITIVAKDQQAVFVEVGGGLRSYSVGGRELLDGYGADEMSSELEVGSVMLKQLIASKYIAALRASEQIDQMDTSDLKVRNRGTP
jgi:hypothetical protein